MTIFVSGGNGFIAGHTIDILIERGYDVITNIRNSEFIVPDNWKGRVKIYNIDSRDATGIYALVGQCDGVINLAGILGTKIKDISDRKKFYENNVDAAWNFIEACIAYKLPMVQITVGNYSEYNFYSNTKVAVERDMILASKYLGLKGNCVRGLNAVGERQKIANTGKIFPTFIDAALHNQHINVYGGKDNCGIMDFVYVRDLASILIDVLEKTKNGAMLGQVVEAGTGKGFSVYDVAIMIKKASESNSEIVEVPMRAGESERSEVVAKNPYPFDYEDLDAIVKKSVEYYRGLL